jgi:hypothetical protein
MMKTPEQTYLMAVSNGEFDRAEDLRAAPGLEQSALRIKVHSFGNAAK